MHITLTKDYSVRADTTLLGYQGETNSRKITFSGLVVDGCDLYKLQILYSDGKVYELPIKDEVVTITGSILREIGYVSCQLLGYSVNGSNYTIVFKSNIFELEIKEAIDGEVAPIPPYEEAADALEQVLAGVEAAKGYAESAGTAADRAETARAEAVKSQNDAKVSAAQASSAAQQTAADKIITAGYAKTAKTNADSTAADRQAVQTLAEQVAADKANVAENATKVAEDRVAAETAAQKAQSVADSLPEDYVTAVAKIAENTADIASIKLTDKEMKRRVDALFDIGQGITHRFETDADTAYAKTIPTGAKLMSVKNVSGKSLAWNQLAEVDARAGKATMYYIEALLDNNRPKYVKGHKYFLKFYAKSDVEPFFVSTGYSSDKKIPFDGDGVAYGNRTSGWQKFILMPNEAFLEKKPYFALRPIRYANNTTFNYEFRDLMLIDLTLMFGTGNEPSTVEEFEKMFPATYYPYNAGEIVSAGTEEIVEQGANLYYGTDMLKCGSDDYEYIANSYRCKTIKLNPKTTYTLSFTSDKTSEIILLMNVNAIVNAPQYFDFRKASHTQTYTTGDDGCLYVGVYAGNGAVASADVVKRLSECEIMISEGDTPTAYAPYHRNEYPIPEAIRNLPGYGWSAGTARNYVDYENKRYVQCVNSVDLGTKNWLMYKDGDYTPFFYLNAGDISDIRGGTSNFLCPKYQYAKIGVTDNASGLYVLENTTVRVRDTAYTDATAFKQAMQGVILYYELANPIVTDISTLIDDDFLRNIEVEAGGSVTFKNGNGDSYRIPVPNEEEYVVKLSEVGGTT